MCCLPGCLGRVRRRLLARRAMSPAWSWRALALLLIEKDITGFFCRLSWVTAHSKIVFHGIKVFRQVVLERKQMNDRTPLGYSTVVTFLRRLFHLRRGGQNFESPRYLRKWLFLSTLIGIIAGLGAIAFFWSIHFASDILLGRIVGYLPPNPTGEGRSMVMPLWSAARPWLLPLITAAGGLG